MLSGSDEWKIVDTPRWLIQVGLAQPVTMMSIGDELTLKMPMLKMVARCSVHRGWATGPHPAGVLTSFFQDLIDEFAYDGKMLFMING